MIRMTVADALEATGASLVCGSAETVFEGVDIDSRKVPQGGAFVAFSGESVDGNRFAASALEAGASMVVLTAAPTQDALRAAEASSGAIVRAAGDDGEQFMLALAAAWRRRNPQWIVVGVTGSVGKTTTKNMLAAGIGACRRTHATRGNFNNLLGVPLTLFAASPDDEVLVVEMGMNNAGELERIAAAALPTVCTITNVGTSHIGRLGSREAIARAKAEVVSGMREAAGVGRTLVLSASDAFSDFIDETFCEPAGVRTVRVGGPEGEVRAIDVALDDDGRPSFTLAFPDGERLGGSLGLPGRAMVFDLLSAMGIVDVLGLDRSRALAGICAMRAEHMRLDVRQNEGTPRVVDDSYNASPSSMAASIDVLCSMACDGRRVAVLGEMGELGAESRNLHGLVGAYVAAKPIDLVVFVGGQGAADMHEAALTMGFSEDKIERFASAEDAARVMVPVFAEDDLVLVKASRAVGLDVFAKEVLGS